MGRAKQEELLHCARYLYLAKHHLDKAMHKALFGDLSDADFEVSEAMDQIKSFYRISKRIDARPDHVRPKKKAMYP